jgi:hypothetical protein
VTKLWSLLGKVLHEDSGGSVYNGMEEVRKVVRQVGKGI